MAKNVFNLFSNSSKTKLQKPSLTKILNKYSGNYSYQKLYMVIIFFIALSMGLIGYSIPYYLYDPIFYCNIDGNIMECPMNKACESNDYQIKFNFYSIVIKFNLYCKREGLKTYISGFIFLFSGISCFFLIYITNNLGKKKAFIIATCFSIIGGSYLFLFDDIVNNVIAFCFLFLGAEYFFTIVFIYINEIFSSKYRLENVTKCYCFWSFGGLIISILGYYMDSYKKILIIQIICCLISLYLSFFLLETPCFLVIKNKYNELLLFFKNIMLYNNIDNRNLENDVFEVNNYYNYEILTDDHHHRYDLNQLTFMTQSMINVKMIKKEEENSLKILLSDKKEIYKLFFITIVLSNMYILYGLTMISVQFIGTDNIFFNGAIMSGFEVIGYLAIVPFAKKIYRKQFIARVNIFIFVIGIILLLLSFSNNSKILILLTVLSGIMKICVSSNLSVCFLFLSELFDMKLRNYACGIAIFFSRTLSILSVVLLYISNIFGIHPLTLGSIINIISIIVLKYLPETFKN